MPTVAFTGLPKDYFRFFTELKAHNDRGWFEANKARYRELVVDPSCAFITAMAPRLAKISRHFVADPRPTGGSMFRIYRDVRFAKDKRPYKEHAGIHFRHALGKTVHAPGLYVHLSPDEVFFGGGVWMPEPEALAQIRRAIAEQPAAWKKAALDPGFVAEFGEVRGEGLVRPPRGFDPEHPYIEAIKKKSFFAKHDSSARAAQSPAFLDEVEHAFRAARPFLKFLCSAVGAPF